MRRYMIEDYLFQSTLSVRRATGVGFAGGGDLVISIHALRKESDAVLALQHLEHGISIHALRKESDTGRHISLTGN